MTIILGIITNNGFLIIVRWFKFLNSNPVCSSVIKVLATTGGLSLDKPIRKAVSLVEEHAGGESRELPRCKCWTNNSRLSVEA